MEKNEHKADKKVQANLSIYKWIKEGGTVRAKHRYGTDFSSYVSMLISNDIALGLSETALGEADDAINDLGAGSSAGRSRGGRSRPRTAPSRNGAD